ncbi:MAG: ABC transporter permease [Candidatus Nitrosopolaris sp.]|jgi:peptide/nickel transport system permease protein
MTTQLGSRATVLRKFAHSRGGIAGIIILIFLILITLYAIIYIPLDSFMQWNNPDYWIDYPKAAAPAWTNIGLKLPEHIILKPAQALVSSTKENGIHIVTHTYTINFNYDSYPTDFMVPYAVKYGQIPPVLQIDIIRPDGRDFRIYSSALPPSLIQTRVLNEFSARVFSTDSLIIQNLRLEKGLFKYPQDESLPQIMLFSQTDQQKVLKGIYQVKETFYLFSSSDSIEKSGLVLGGRVYGLMGTDELRRDLTIGILWGTPIALFIGLTVSIASISIGLIYGVFAGYKGKRTDEGMMRINDFFYSLPILPLLVILSLTIGRSIFLITGFLVIFGWVGTAKIIRSLALQLKNLQYIEAAKLMGQSDIKIIFKHVIPQLLPLTFASIALAVPAAILTEAALSFLGLGDPSIPTWGQILHDANSGQAAARGLWWWIIPPGLMIALTGLAFAFMGYAVESTVNIKNR